MIRLVTMLARQSPWQFGLSMLTSIIGGLATTAVLVVVLGALRNEAGATVWLFTALVLLAIGGRGASRILVAAVTRVAVFTVRQRLAEAIATTSLADIERLGGTRLRGAMTGDAGRLGTTLPIIVNVLSSLSFLFGCLAYLGWLQPTRLAGVVAVIAVGAIFYRALHGRVRGYAGVGRQVWDEIVGSCSLLVGGIKQIKADDGRRDDLLDQLVRQSRASMRAWSGHAWVSNFAVMGTQTMFYATLGAVIFARAEWGMNPDEVLRFGLAIVYMAGPLREVVTALPELAEAEIAYARIESVDSSLRDAKSRVTAEPGSWSAGAPAAWSQIELVDVSLRYGAVGSTKFILQPASFTLRRGEVVFIVGGNGTGKTTLGKVLTGLYAPTEGEILVDGIPVDETNRAWHLHQFASIFSDFVLFERVCRIETGIARTRADALLVRLDMAGKVELRDLRLSRTTGLSSGERKRLALMAACLADRPAMLFDEWAADQDPRFKDIFYRQIVPELREAGKAVVIISHDERYFDVANTIVFLERGLPARVERRSLSTECAR